MLIPVSPCHAIATCNNTVGSYYAEVAILYNTIIQLHISFLQIYSTRQPEYNEQSYSDLYIIYVDKVLLWLVSLSPNMLMSIYLYVTQYHFN
jgi:hypothetical protein